MENDSRTTRATTLRARRQHRRLATVLFVSFGLTVAGFVTSSCITETRQGNLGSAAQSIATNAVPSMEVLVSLRTTIRRMEVMLDDYVDRIAFDEPADVGRGEIEADRTLVDAELAHYMELPTYPGERDHWPALNAAMVDVRSAITHVFAEVDRADGPAAELVLARDAKPAIERFDDELRVAHELNAKNAAHLAAEIRSDHHAARTWAILLDLGCALFGLIAAFSAVRVVRRYAQLMDARVEELDQIAGRIAHDIRSPLTAVNIGLALARKDPGLKERNRDAVDRASRSLGRVAQVIEGLLDFARADAGPGRDEPGVDVKQILEEVVDELGPTAEERAIELTLEVGIAPPCTAACSRGVLVSLVSNLAGNAVKHMGIDGAEGVAGRPRRVIVRASASDSRVRVEVDDTGPGIPQDLLGRIFDPHVRAANSTAPGLGLGLATARQLAERHGGEIGVKSTLGVGSLFWFELPRSA